MANTARFVSDNGSVYEFGPKGHTAFTINSGDGISVDFGTTQGFGKVGEIVAGESVGSKLLEVRGFIYKDTENKKKELRKVFAPFQSGKLIINEKYYIYVIVKDSPSFSIMKNNGSFVMRLYAAYPFFKKVESKLYEIGGVVPKFSFPVNYAEPHQFGVDQEDKKTLVLNEGDVEATYFCKIIASGDCEYIHVLNNTTGELLKIDVAITKGEVIELYRDNNNFFNAKLKTSSGEEDILHLIDEKSDFFSLPVGAHTISAYSLLGDFSVQFSFEESVVSVFED